MFSINSFKDTIIFVDTNWRYVFIVYLTHYSGENLEYSNVVHVYNKPILKIIQKYVRVNGLLVQ